MNTRTDKFYNRFSVFYPVVDLFLKPQKRSLFQEINRLSAGKLLEIGVGNGKHLPLYKTHTVTGIDTSSAMLNAAKKHSGSNIELLHMNGETLLFPEQTFDYVVLSHVIAVVDDPEKLLEETYRVLKPGGTIFILNHFTPGNGLKYLDRSFQLFSGMFHFKSVFHINALKALEKYTLVKEMNVDRFSYFKLLIYNKA